jgi:hypothetical protein
MKLFNQTLIVEWDKFQPGTSFFIPCFDWKQVKREVFAEAKRMQIPIVCMRVKERGAMGLRFWNTGDRVTSHSSLTPPERT